MTPSPAQCHLFLAGREEPSLIPGRRWRPSAAPGAEPGHCLQLTLTNPSSWIHPASREEKLSSSLCAGGSGCWAGTQLGFQTLKFLIPHFIQLKLFILVILVISWRSELLCVVVLQQMNTSLKLGTGEANFMSILNLTELSGSDWPGCPSQSRILKQSRLEETDFSLQKLSFPPRK